VVSRVGQNVELVLDSHQQGVIFYIVEEAVGNARKSAEAELISVDITRKGDVVVVEVADNGVGFDTDAVNANYDQRGSLGMINMRERTALLDGTLRIDSKEGYGTTVTVMVPIKKDGQLHFQPGNRPMSSVGKLPATLDSPPR
jgi:signal transduction histidine kinase